MVLPTVWAGPGPRTQLFSSFGGSGQRATPFPLLSASLSRRVFGSLEPEKRETRMVGPPSGQLCAIPCYTSTLPPCIPDPLHTAHAHPQSTFLHLTSLFDVVPVFSTQSSAAPVPPALPTYAPAAFLRATAPRCPHTSRSLLPVQLRAAPSSPSKLARIPQHAAYLARPTQHPATRPALPRRCLCSARQHSSSFSQKRNLKAPVICAVYTSPAWPCLASPRSRLFPVRPASTLPCLPLARPSVL
jgi:hypothetical protein